MKITVIGAGNIGIYVGGFLVSKSLNVTFLGRERIKNEIIEHGLTLSNLDGYENKIPSSKIDFKTNTDEIEKSDLYILTVKTQDTISILKSLKQIIDDKSIIISLQNGISNFDLIKSIYPNSIIIPGMVPFNVFKKDSGIYKCTTSGEIIFQSTDYNSFINNLFYNSTLPYRLDSDIFGILYGKLIFNLNNPINALCNLPLREELMNPEFRFILSNSMSEALVVYKHAKIKPKSLGKMIPWIAPYILRLPNWLFFRVASNMIKIDPTARSSMWEDLKNLKITEIDYITGEILRLADKFNVKIPFNRKIYSLVKEAELRKKGSPALSSSELMKEIEIG